MRSSPRSRLVPRPAKETEPVRLTPFKRAFATLVRGFFRSICRIRVVGLDTLPPSGPLILVANHVSNADGVILQAWLQPALGRPARFLAKEQLFRTPLRPLLLAFGTILVRAGGSDVDAYRQARAALMRGEVVGIFPEGSRSPDGVLQPAHEGVTLLAARAGVLVLPVGIDGTDVLLPRGAVIPRVGSRVTVRVGEPFTVSLDPSRDRREAVSNATHDLMARIAVLVPAARRGDYAPARERVNPP